MDIGDYNELKRFAIKFDILANCSVESMIGCMHARLIFYVVNQSIKIVESDMIREYIK